MTRRRELDTMVDDTMVDDTVARAVGWVRRLGALGVALLAVGDRWLGLAATMPLGRALALAGALLVVDASSGRRSRARVGVVASALISCAGDLVIALAAVVVVGVDDFGPALLLLAVPAIEAAVRYRLAGALGVPGLATVVWGSHAMLVSPDPWIALVDVLVPTLSVMTVAVPVGLLADRLVDAMAAAESARQHAEQRARLAGVLAVAGAGLRRRRPVVEVAAVLGGAMVHLGAEAVELTVETIGRRETVYRRGTLDPDVDLTWATIRLGDGLELRVAAQLPDDALVRDAVATLLDEAQRSMPTPTSRGSLAMRLNRYLATPNRGWLAVVRVELVDGDAELVDRRVRALRRRGHVTGRLAAGEWAVVVAGAQAEVSDGLVAGIDRALLTEREAELRYRIVVASPAERLTTTDLLARVSTRSCDPVRVSR